MNTSPSHMDIITALRQSGYLMEQQVATQLEALDLHVWTNWAFEDIDEGKSREIDVRAIRRVAYNEEKKLAGFIEIIGECKNNSNPLVFIGRPRSDVDRLYAPEELVFPITQYKRTRPRMTRDEGAFFHLGFDRVHYDFAAEMKAVQFCRIERKSKNWHANHGGLYDSIFYPIAKALTARKREIGKDHRRSEWRYFWFFVPVVVTSGNIFFVDSTAAEPVPEETNYVTFKRDIQSEKLKGTFAVAFIRQNQLEQFFTECLQPLIDKMVYLTTNDSDFVLKQEIPWEE